jgi:hypothetical protein
MANYGAGIGSFVSGIAQGAKMRSLFDKEDREKEEHDINMRSKQFNLQNAQEVSDRQRKEFEYQTSEREKNAPVLDAERTSQLGKLNAESELRDTARTAYDTTKKEYDDLKGRSILTATDAQGKKHVTVDGQEVENEERAGKLFQQKRGSFSRYFIENGGAAGIRDAYIRQGDVAKADAFDKFIRQEGVQKATDDYGLGLQAASVKDWKGATDIFNRLVTNGEYVATGDHKVKFEPIYSDAEVAKSESAHNRFKRVPEKQNGIRVSYEDKDGNRSVKDYTDNKQFFSEMQSVLHPYSIFEINKSTYDAGVNAKVKDAERASKLANDIVLGKMRSNYKMDEREQDSALKVIEERAKREGFDPKEVTKEAIDLLKTDMENGNRILGTAGKDGKIVPPTGEQAFDLAIDRVIEARRTAANAPSATQGGALQAGIVNPRRVLRSRSIAPAATGPVDPGITRAM